MTDAIACPCGATGDMAVYAPGTAAEVFEGIVLTRAVPTLGWCSVDCAKRDGWPWLHSEKRRARRRRTATA